MGSPEMMMEARKRPGAVERQVEVAEEEELADGEDDPHFAEEVEEEEEGEEEEGVEEEGGEEGENWVPTVKARCATAGAWKCARRRRGLTWPGRRGEAGSASLSCPASTQNTHQEKEGK